MSNDIVLAAIIARSHSLEETKVGAAVRAEDGRIFAGTNLTHRWVCSVHAEVVAIAVMVSAGQQRFTQAALVCERTQFTPCGACLDWMLQFARSDAVEVLVGDGNGMTSFTLADLMPFYPGAWARNA